jgi:hypothetical protein
MPSKARLAFEENQADVNQLWKIHQEFAGGGAGRKWGVDVLNRAAIVFVTAIWESFVEDLAAEAFKFLLSNAPDASKIPTKVKDAATKPIFDQKDSRKVWDLADSGWRGVLQSHEAETLRRWLGDFNTPKAAKVDELYEALLGIPGLSKSWSWQNMSADTAKSRLDEYITVRGSIAHRAKHRETVYKDWGTAFLGHVNSIVDKCDNAVAQHLENRTGKKPW